MSDSTDVPHAKHGHANHGATCWWAAKFERISKSENERLYTTDPVSLKKGKKTNANYASDWLKTVHELNFISLISFAIRRELNCNVVEGLPAKTRPFHSF